jgi:hypothetical protein
MIRKNVAHVVISATTEKVCYGDIFFEYVEKHNKNTNPLG